jgi:hypothetical protein
VLLAEGIPPARRRAALIAVARHHVLSRTGALLGSSAERLPAGARRRLSLEARGSFVALDPSAEQMHTIENTTGR